MIEVDGAKAARLVLGVMMAATVVAGCGGGDDEASDDGGSEESAVDAQSSITAAPTTAAPTTAAPTTEAPTTAAPPTAAPTTTADEAADDAEETEADTESSVAGAREVQVLRLVLQLPEGWTSIPRGEDVVASLEEQNPAALALLEQDGVLDGLRAASGSEWTGVSPNGGVVTVVFGSASFASTPPGDIADSLIEGAESDGYTIIKDGPHASLLGTGAEVGYNYQTAQGARSMNVAIISSDGELMIFTSNAKTAAEAESQLDELLDAARLS